MSETKKKAASSTKTERLVSSNDSDDTDSDTSLTLLDSQRQNKTNLRDIISKHNMKHRQSMASLWEEKMREIEENKRILNEKKEQMIREMEKECT